MGDLFTFYYSIEYIEVTKVLDRSTFGRLLKSQQELLPFGALCNLIAKMHSTSKFWLIKFMDANLF